MSLRGTLVRVAATGGAVALALGLAGCGDIDAGSGAIDKLHAVVDGWDELVGVDEESQNNLPWMGTASAVVIVDPETSTDRVAEMSERLSAFLDKEDGGTAHWSFVDIQVGGFRLGVLDDATKSSQLFSAFEALRSDDRVVGGFVRTSDDWIVSSDSSASDDPPERLLGGVSQSVRAIVGDDVPLAEAFGIARSAADRVDMLADSPVVAETEDGGSAVSDSNGSSGGATRKAPPSASLGLASAIASAAPVADVVATTDRLSVRLERSADVTAIDQTFSARSIQLGIDLTVNGGVVSQDGSASSSVLAVAQSLDGREGVEAVSVSSSRITVTLSGAGPLPDVISTLRAQPGIGSVDSVTLTAGAEREPGFSVSGPPDDLERLGSLVAAGSTHPVLSRLIATDNRTELQVTVDPDVASLRALFSDIRPLIADGSTVSVEAERKTGFTNAVEFIAADDIDIDLPEGTSAEVTALAGIVASAWASSS